VLLDALIGVRLLRAGSRVIFDDYFYYEEMTQAINAFHQVPKPHAYT